MGSPIINTVGIIGMGYVGLPAALAFSKKYRVIGFDIDERRILDLKSGNDFNGEHANEEIIGSNILFSFSESDLVECDAYIITVPTPIDKHKNPVLEFIKTASLQVGRVISKGNIVVFESTVYPGCTEEICIPIIEDMSNFRLNRDFMCGYSPERINPSDKKNTFINTNKIVAGSNNKCLENLMTLYQSVIVAEVYPAASIKVAEAAKIIENTQRDLNVALINEFSKIFKAMGIDTQDVLDAASTKWNFLPFTPGLVGGHCIGVDPYYLTHKAIALGCQPNLILAGREINESVADRIAHETVQGISQAQSGIANGIKILIMGCTFKENCVDVRNSKTFSVIEELHKFGCEVDVYDPVARYGDVFDHYGIRLISTPRNNYYDGVIVAVPHNEILELGIERIHTYGVENCIIYDVKSVFDKTQTDLRL